MTLKDCLLRAYNSLSTADIPSARLDTELILAHVLQKNRTWLITHDGYILSKLELKEADELVDQRAKRVPLAYLTGHKEFYGRDFIVTPDVLIPRPETEDLIEIIKQLFCSNPPTPNSQLPYPAPRILDVGCGSGCIGLTAKMELSNTNVTLSDFDESALKIAQQNSESLGAKPVTFVESDLLEHWLHQDSPELYDVIVSNLPYVDRDWETSPELAHEPDMALYADDNGMEIIKKLIDQSSQLLMRNGYLLLEADPRQFDAIEAYANEFTPITRQNYALLLQLVV